MTVIVLVSLLLLAVAAWPAAGPLPDPKDNIGQIVAMMEATRLERGGRVREAIAKQDWLRLLIPEDHGGMGGTIFDYALLCEGLARYGFDFATAFMVSTFTAMNIVKFGTDAPFPTQGNSVNIGTVEKGKYKLKQASVPVPAVNKW